MHVHICIYIDTYINIYIHLHTHISTLIHRRTHWSSAREGGCVWHTAWCLAPIYTDIHKYIYTPTNLYTICIYTCGYTHTHTHIYIHTPIGLPTGAVLERGVCVEHGMVPDKTVVLGSTIFSSCSEKVNVFMCIFKYICICMHMYIYIYIYIYMCVWICVCGLCCDP